LGVFPLHSDSCANERRGDRNDFSEQSNNAKDRTARVSDEDEAVSGAGGASRRAGIIARLYAALDQKMREIENRIERTSRIGAEELTAADSERDARTLTALARLFEKLTDLDGAESDSINKTNWEEGHLTGKEIDAERFRRDIADRLTRMLKAEQD